MARDGGGVYSLPANTRVTTGTTIESAPYNSFLDDIETDMNTDRPVVAGGTGASTAAGARANLGVRDLSAMDTAGSSNAYTLTSGDSLTPSDGDIVAIIANHTNTGAATIDVDSNGAVSIKKMVGGTATALAAGDITSGVHYTLHYDATETAWLLVGGHYDPANVAITGGAISGITDLPVADGGTGASTAGDARTNLGLVIGTDVQAYDAGLGDIAGLAVTDGNVIVGDGANWVAESGATARASLGLTIGTDVQAYDAELAALAGLTSAADKLPYFDGSASAAVTDLTAAARSVLDDTTTDAMLTTLGATPVGQIAGFTAKTGTSENPALSDIGKVITMNNASANTLTIQTNATVAFSIGDWFSVIQIGAGTTTVTGDTGVTVNGVSGGGAESPFRYAFVTCIKVGTNEWYMNVDGVA